MNFAIIRYILGWVLTFEGGFMLLPCIVALCYQEKSGFIFLLCALAAGLAGRLLTGKKPKNTVLLKEHSNRSNKMTLRAFCYTYRSVSCSAIARAALPLHKQE